MVLSRGTPPSKRLIDWRVPKRDALEGRYPAPIDALGPRLNRYVAVLSVSSVPSVSLNPHLEEEAACCSLTIALKLVAALGS